MEDLTASRLLSVGADVQQPNAAPDGVYGGAATVVPTRPAGPDPDDLDLLAADMPWLAGTGWWLLGGDGE